MDPNTIIGGVSALAALGSLAIQLHDARQKKCGDDGVDRTNTQQAPSTSDTLPNEVSESSADDE
ncbi:hypothetical protein [Streptomyces ehimensis]|uniref:Uncharacterized protein n=1 Tax=Streptomyces ehimensis TaxID=68195 RepID=A0ABV9BWJ3_9ACTN